MLRTSQFPWNILSGEWWIELSFKLFLGSSYAFPDFGNDTIDKIRQLVQLLGPERSRGKETELVWRIVLLMIFVGMSIHITQRLVERRGGEGRLYGWHISFSGRLLLYMRMLIVLLRSGVSFFKYRRVFCWPILPKIRPSLFFLVYPLEPFNAFSKHL